jgi:hypothetical protein
MREVCMEETDAGTQEIPEAKKQAQGHMKSLRRKNKGQEPRIFLRLEKQGQPLQGIPRGPLVPIHQLPRRSNQGSTPVVAERRKRHTSHRAISH